MNINEIDNELIIKIEARNKNKSESITFKALCDDYGTITDGWSFNPVSGWTNWTGFTSGWSEIDDDLTELLNIIKEYSINGSVEEQIKAFLYESRELKCTSTAYNCTDWNGNNIQVTIRIIQFNDEEV